MTQPLLLVLESDESMLGLLAAQRTSASSIERRVSVGAATSGRRHAPEFVCLRSQERHCGRAVYRTNGCHVDMCIQNAAWIVVEDSFVLIERKLL